MGGNASVAVVKTVWKSAPFEHVTARFAAHAAPGTATGGEPALRPAVRIPQDLQAQHRAYLDPSDLLDPTSEIDGRPRGMTTFVRGVLAAHGTATRLDVD